MPSKPENNGLSQNHKHVDDPDYRCGIGCCHIPYLQRFANASGFTAFFILPLFASQTLTTYINSQIPTLEKQFGLSSYESGIIMTFNDFGFLFVGLLTSSIPKLVHIPRWLFCAILIFAFSGLLCSLPHFIIQSELHLSKLSQNVTNNLSMTSSNEPLYPLCTDHNGTEATKNKMASLGVSLSASLKSLSVGLIGIGMVLQGAGKSLRSPFLTQYLDGENKQKTGFHLGILSSAGIFGPAVAFALGGLFSRLYVTLEDVDMSTKDPRWIGAWWLGFIVFGIFSLLVAFPVVCFPRRLTEKVQEKQEPGESLVTRDDKPEEEPKVKQSKFSIFKERASSYIRVMKSQVYVCMVIGSVLHMSSVLGPVAFKSKYIEAQFGIPLWKANLLISGIMTLTVSCGAFFGGLITKKFKLSPRMMLVVVIILHIGQMVFHGGLIFIGCPQPDIVGPKNLPSQLTNITENCHCDVEDYFPVCGSNNVNYYSPCYAGCTDVIRNGRIYQNCTMIPDGQATAGLCPFKCNSLIPYLILNVIGFASGSLKIMPLFISTIRSVEDRDKSTAAGLKSVLLSTLAFIPAPIVYGKVIDTACIVWNRSSKRKGACSLYNIENFRYGMFSTVIIYKSTALVFFCIAVYKVWRIKDWTELRKKTGNRKTNGANGRIKAASI